MCFEMIDIPIDSKLVRSKNVTLEYHDLWKIDVETGIVSYPTTQKRYEPDHDQLSKKSGMAKLNLPFALPMFHSFPLLNFNPDLITDVNRYALGISQVTFKDVRGSGSLQWLRLHYTTENPKRKCKICHEDSRQEPIYTFLPQYQILTIYIVLAESAYIIVNDEHVVNISTFGSHSRYHSSIPIQLTLKSGEVNKISVGRYSEGITTIFNPMQTNVRD
jgi:hypothetical protein